ncbi:MAG: response regulator [Chloroflexi bacterium]|nr:response regulator [Chloroflexota bacterium]
MIWLVAEDEADIRMLVATMIQVWGHETVVFENGQKVWDWLDTIETTTNGNGSHENGSKSARVPDLILMDIRMPGKKGNEIARRMRTLPQMQQIPIVLMTAFSLNEIERQEMMAEGGVDRIISKPLPDFEQLRQILHDLVEQKRTEANS